MYDAGDFKFLATMPSPPGQSWMGGNFVAADCILVWSRVSCKFYKRRQQHVACAVLYYMQHAIRYLFLSLLGDCKFKVHVHHPVDTIKILRGIYKNSLHELENSHVLFCLHRMERVICTNFLHRKCNLTLKLQAQHKTFP